MVVSILIAFLVKSDQRSSLKWVWGGVAAALLICVGIGTAIAYTIGELRFEQQEIVGGSLSIVAVAFVTWMIFWMRATARTIAKELRGGRASSPRPRPPPPRFPPRSTCDLDPHPFRDRGRRCLRRCRSRGLRHDDPLRRGYNFTDGTDGLGHLDAGLFFVCFNRDSRKQFVPMQRALSTKESMMEYLEHTGSGLFAVPPGVSKEGYRGETLFSR